MAPVVGVRFIEEQSDEAISKFSRENRCQILSSEFVKNEFTIQNLTPIFLLDKMEKV